MAVEGYSGTSRAVAFWSLISVEMNKIGDEHRRLLGDYIPNTIIAYSTIKLLLGLLQQTVGRRGLVASVGLGRSRLRDGWGPSSDAACLEKVKS